MKKIKIVILSMLILISLSTNVMAISTSHVATMTAITAAATSTSTASRVARHRNTYSIDDIAKDVFYETQNEELKNYILENEQYLYLNDKNETEAIINKYKESNLEETKQFIKDNYYDENKPKNERKLMTILAIIIIVLLTCAVIIATIA